MNHDRHLHGITPDNQQQESAVIPPAPWPVTDPAIVDAVQLALSDGSWGQYYGRHGDQLARDLAEYHDVAHVKLCSSGTIGVELALRGVGIQAGDEVILAGYDYPGNFRSIDRVGGHPVLVDVAQDTLAVDPSLLDTALSDKTRALIVSHLHSGIAPMPEIMDWGRRNRIWVIEDTCQAHGANVHGRVAGSWGDIGVLSFGGSKLITAGRGGAILVKRADHFQRITIYADQGNDAYPLSELQSAVVWPQWNSLDHRNTQRRQQVARLIDGLQGFELLEFAGRSDRVQWPSYYKVAWWWDRHQQTTLQRDQLCALLRARGVPMDGGFRGFVKRSSRRCRRIGDLPVSHLASERLMVFHHPILLQSTETIKQVVHTMRQVLDRLARGNLG